MVVDTRQISMPTFSDVAIASPAGMTEVFNAIRQVAVVQCVDATGAIQWQHFFHGDTPLQPGGGLATNARAISVFPGATGADTRVAICGDTFDQSLPLGQATNTQFQNLQASGFIAVYSGDGTLQWSWLFFGDNSGGHCAITDVSIRVEGSPPTEVVTFCGASSFGHGVIVPPAMSTIRALQPFLPPPANCQDNPAGGNTDNGVGSWDGIVGRLVRTAPAPPTEVFLSIVGGGEQDALFGIAEIDADLFAVVGTTRLQPQPSSIFTFPVTSTLECVTSTVDAMMGTLQVFDAAPTRDPNPSNLVLVASRLIGPNRLFPGNEMAAETCLRDVAIVGDRICVVGSTNDDGLPTAFAFDTLFDGPTEGVVGCTTLDLVNVLPDGLLQLSYFGGPGDDGLSGIAAWTEYQDHFAVAGFSSGAGSPDLVAASIWVANASNHPNAQSLQLVRSHTVAGPGAESPAAVGITHALNGSPSYVNGNLGAPDGGGVAVDPRFRVSIAGRTDTGITPLGGGRPFSAPMDGVRFVLDMLPPDVCRTDGSGQCTGAPVPQGVGTTTPICALSAFGNLIELPPTPPPDLQRILIDFQGTNVPGATDAALILDRPPSAYQIQGTFLQFGFISNPPLIVDTVVEVWTNSGNEVFFAQLPTQPESIFFKLSTLPMQSGAVTAQFLSVVANPLCGGITTVAGSPALTFNW